jgi:hypothetical protein
LIERFFTQRRRERGDTKSPTHFESIAIIPQEEKREEKREKSWGMAVVG